MLSFIAVIITIGASWFGFETARRFVRDRLRYVEAAQRPVAPLIAAAGAIVLATPVAWVLPLIGTGSALIFGMGVGMGVSAGARDIRRGTHLPPGTGSY